jgi:hypothetical protein
VSVDQPLTTTGVAHSPLDGLIDPSTTLGADQNISGFRQEDYPALYRAADAASRRARIAHTRLVGAELMLLVGAAVIGAGQSLLLGAASGWQRALPAVLLVAALITKLANRLQRFDEHWFDGRAVAETVKSATWRYVMSVRPYERGRGATGYHPRRGPPGCPGSSSRTGRSPPSAPNREPAGRHRADAPDPAHAA